MNYQLAQLNIAKMKYSLDAPEMRDFVDALDPVNQHAEAFPGFIWRLKGDSGDATEFQIYSDPTYLVNMSVWESVEALKSFVVSQNHNAIMKRSSEWFEKMDEAYTVMWWVEAGHRPSVQEAQGKLDSLRERGPTPAAFHFGKTFPPPE